MARRPIFTLWLLRKLGASHLAARYPECSLSACCMIHAFEYLVLWGGVVITYSAIFDERFNLIPLVGLVTCGSALFGLLAGWHIKRRS